MPSSTVQFALFELFLIAIFGIPVIIIFVYFLTLLYKCLCSKNYNQWRQTWSTSNIRRQYNRIHKRYYSTSNNQNEEEEDEEEVEDEDNAVEVTNDLIKLNRNAQQHFPIDLIVFTNKLCATRDLNTQITIWNLLTRECVNTINIGQQNQNEIISIWSLCFLNDEILIIGLSNGQLLAYNYLSKYPLCLSNYDNCSYNTIGVTHVVKFKNQIFSLLISRLNGYIEHFQLELRDGIYKLNLIKQVQAHLYAITFLGYEFDFILTATAQEQTIKVFKQKNIEHVYSLQHNSNLISSLALSKMNPTIAISGYKNGSICVWNLLNGTCKYKLNVDKRNNKNGSSIIKIEITSEVIISLNRIQKLNIWSLSNGHLLNELYLNDNLSNIKISSMFMCTDNYLFTTCIDQQNIYILVSSLNQKTKNNSGVVPLKRFSINTKFINKIKLFDIIKLENVYDDYLLIQDSHDSIYLLKLVIGLKLD